MFVRWKLRRLKRHRRGYRAGEEILSAVIVESRRTDGQPRQRVVRYIGSIRESDIARPRPLILERFWQQADATLDALGIDGATRMAMDSTVSARVPRPDPDVLERTRAEFEGWKVGAHAIMHHLVGRRPRRPSTRHVEVR